MNKCKHRFDATSATLYVTICSPSATGEPTLRFDLTGCADSVPDAIVQATRLSESFKLDGGNVWYFHSIEQKCLDCGKLITFYDLQGANPE